MTTEQTSVKDEINSIRDTERGIAFYAQEWTEGHDRMTPEQEANNIRNWAEGVNGYSFAYKYLSPEARAYVGPERNFRHPAAR